MKSKTEQIILLKEFLVTQMNHWIFFPLYVTAIVVLNDIIGKGTPYILLWLALGGIPFLLYMGRRKLHKLGTFALLHLAVLAIMFFIPAPHITIKILYVFIGIIYAVYSSYLNFKTEHREDSKASPLLSVGVSFAMLYILHYQEHFEWDKIFVMILILTLGFYFVIYYIDQYQNFLKVNNSSAGHIPASKMFRSGMGLVLGYTGIGIVILLLISNIDWLRGILIFIKNLLLSFLNWIFSLFPKSSGQPISNETNSQTITPMDVTGMLEADETFWLWNVLEYVLEIVFVVAIVVGLVKLLLVLYKFMKSRMGNWGRKEDFTSEEAVVDVHEKCDIEKNSTWKLKMPFFSTNPKERIRQMYKKRILSSRSIFAAQSSKALNQYTAQESSMLLEREALASVYEKARYSNEECDNEDVKRMRNACK